MAIALFTIGTASGTSASDIVLSVPNGVPVGSTLILVVYDPANLGGSGHGAATDTASPPNTYFAGRGTTGLSPNNVVADGTMTLGFTYACNAIPAGGTITYTPLGAGGAVFSACYTTGTTATAGNDEVVAFGSSTAPSATLNAVPETNSLVFAALATFGPGTDTFTQDSTHAAYTTPPVRASLSTTATIAGGSVISSSQLTYAPTITSRPWVLAVNTLAPSYILGPISIGTGSSTSASQISITPPATVPVGAVICVAVCDSGTANTNLPSDTQGNTYSTIATEFNDTSGTASGFTTLYYSFTSTQLTTSDSVRYTPVGSGGGAVSVFYITGLNNDPPYQVSSIGVARAGIATSPTASQAAAALRKGSMTLGILGTHGPSTDTFTQDNTNAQYVSFPTRVGNSTTSTIAGGAIIHTGSDIAGLTYAPTITARAWGEIVVAFNAQPFTERFLTGVSGTGAVGTVSKEIDTSTIGVAAIGAVGAVTASTEVDARLTGVSATGAVTKPTIEIDESGRLAGVAATGAVGTLSKEIDAALIGVSATGAVANLLAGLTFKGVAAVGAVGTVTSHVDPTVFLSGVSATGVAGNILFPVAHGGSGDKPHEEGDQWSRYLAWREQQWRKRHAQKPIEEPSAPPDPPPAPAPVVPASVKLDPVIVPDRMMDQWQQQHPLVPAAQLAPFATPAPRALPLPQLPNQLELLRRQMKIKI